jgi:hypothetical protein
VSFPSVFILFLSAFSSLSQFHYSFYMILVPFLFEIDIFYLFLPIIYKLISSLLLFLHTIFYYHLNFHTLHLLFFISNVSRETLSVYNYIQINNLLTIIILLSFLILLFIELLFIFIFTFIIYLYIFSLVFKTYIHTSP